MAFSKTTAFELIQRADANGRLAHAYLICGAAGSGKRDLVAQIASAFCGPSSSKDIFSHPDLHIAEPESKSRRIVTEQVRALERELQMRSSTGGRKIGVIFEADRLQIQAANAFLKTLEEPPQNSLLLLATALPEALPDTIISRCIAIQLTPGPQPALTDPQRELLEAALKLMGEDSRPLSRIYNLVRLFTQLLQQAKEQIKAAHASELKKEQALYKQTTEGKYLEDREEYFDALTESRYVQARFSLVDTLVQFWADLARQQQNFSNLDFPQHAAKTAEIAGRISLAETLRRLDQVEELRENLGRNVQEQLAIEVAFLKAFA